MAQAGPSANLSWAELACRDGSPYPAEWRADRAPELAAAFERIRALCGFPLIVNSAFRTAVYNDRIGGAVHSQHVQGRALDLCPSRDGAKGLRALRGAAETARREGLLRGIGIYSGFVHIDTRPGRAATWGGSRGPE
jgi:uncharacterized protein YcbK (DUF882 family)